MRLHEMIRASAGAARRRAPFDARSKGVVATLLPAVRPYARALVEDAQAAGIALRIVAGSRSDAEQAALYARGRTLPGHIVTDALPGHTPWNFGIAFDVGVFEGRDYLAASPTYREVGRIGEALGLEWGGPWTTMDDRPHFLLRPRWARGLSEPSMCALLRARRADGIGAFA